MKNSDPLIKVGFDSILEESKKELIEIGVGTMVRQVTAWTTGVLLLVAACVLGLVGSQSVMIQSLIGIFLAFGLSLLGFLLTGTIELDNTVDREGGKGSLRATAGGAILVLFLAIWFGIPFGNGIDGVMQTQAKISALEEKIKLLEKSDR